MDRVESELDTIFISLAFSHPFPCVHSRATYPLNLVAPRHLTTPLSMQQKDKVGRHWIQQLHLPTHGCLLGGKLFGSHCNYVIINVEMRKVKEINHTLTNNESEVRNKQLIQTKADLLEINYVCNFAISRYDIRCFHVLPLVCCYNFTPTPI